MLYQTRPPVGPLIAPGLTSPREMGIKPYLYELLAVWAVISAMKETKAKKRSPHFPLQCSRTVILHGLRGKEGGRKGGKKTPRRIWCFTIALTVGVTIITFLFYFFLMFISTYLNIYLSKHIHLAYDLLLETTLVSAMTVHYLDWYTLPKFEKHV